MLRGFLIVRFTAAPYHKLAFFERSGVQMQLMFKDTTLLVLVGSFIVDTVQDMMRRYLRITPIQ